MASDALSFLVVPVDAGGVWICIRLGSCMSSVIDDLSAAAHRIAGGNFAWRMPVRSKDQLGDLSCNFNEVAIAQDRPQEEAAAEESSMSIFAQESECRG